MSLASLRGKWGYKAGSSGTPAIPAGAQILSIIAHASSGGATVAINGGDAIPIINAAPPTVIQFLHLLVVSPNGGGGVVFTSTDSYFVEYVDPRGT